MVCLRTETEKLIHYVREGEGDEFYDLVEDPEERKNVFGDSAYAERVKQMQSRIEETQQEYAFEVPDLSDRY